MPACEQGSDEAYVLLTNGMSERRMAVPAGADVKPRAELMWYVRDATAETSANLRWLASLPFIGDTWYLHRYPRGGRLLPRLRTMADGH